MSRTSLSKLRLQLMRCVKLIDKYERRMDQMKAKQEIAKSVLMTLKAQIEAKEAMADAIPNHGTQTGT